ncbi:beta-lactamase family protein [Stieleria sp. JC731]|uniref:serine hydrolase domain-containing protein n=1 Tax=Pirellulaceae TaxID=2691357 RepID=UPI001E4EB254|nr:serine hydrolase domain-containing protein [Stieleria sp. JC731]MCC9603711.1 beta-lactamase family protein [Stieleria sp. JC731]
MVTRASIVLVFGLGVGIVVVSSVMRGAAPIPEPELGSPVTTRVLLTPPEFDDVSSFGRPEMEQIDDWLKNQIDLAALPSISVAIVKEGQIVYQGAFGFEDVASRTKVTTETAYHVASVSKVFTTFVAMQLYARQVIDLDAPVSRYLPEGTSIGTDKALGETITLRQLASHTSGLPRGIPGPVQSIEGRYQLEPSLLYEQLAKVQLGFVPGTDEEYSNLGLGLLGHVLERATGKPLESLVSVYVCETLDLEHTCINPAERMRIATGYSSLSPRVAEGHSYRERLAGSGGIISTATDLAKFLAAQMELGALSIESLEQMHSPVKLSDGSYATTGLGWSIRSRDSIGAVIKKNGGRNNCKAWIGFSPEHRVGVAVLTNCGDPSVDPIGYWLLERSVAGVDAKLLRREPVVDHQYAKVAAFTGLRWENGWTIVEVDGKWRRLVSINGTSIDRILAYCRRAFGEKAEKRFAEDIVEVMSRMGYEIGWEVSLELQSDIGEVERVKTRLTHEKRNALRK